jgi:uncharacterized protein (TIGR03067 family)
MRRRFTASGLLVLAWLGAAVADTQPRFQEVDVCARGQGTLKVGDGAEQLLRKVRVTLDPDGTAELRFVGDAAWTASGRWSADKSYAVVIDLSGPGKAASGKAKVVLGPGGGVERVEASGSTRDREPFAIAFEAQDGNDLAQFWAQELDRLRGTWAHVRTENSGKAVAGEDAKNTLVFAGDKWTRYVDGKVYAAGTVKLGDPTAVPLSLDLLVSEGPGKGNFYASIYSVEGETLRICFGGAGKDRPTAFLTKDGDGCTSSTWKRAK